jgi:hypothetical protein
MKKVRTIASIVASLIILLTACSKDKVLDAPNLIATQSNSSARIAEEDQQIMRKEFGLALAKALKESKELRILLKRKALEMIDEDYDVLFALIRDEVLVDKLSVKDLFAKHLKNKVRLSQIEEALPTLTIFIPQLPNGSFSAQSWDTENVVPKVGIKSIKTNDVPIIDSEGTESILPAKYAPGFPVIVVKNSLRIMESTNSEFSKVKSKSILTASNGKSYRFISDSFDRNLNKRKKGARLIGASQIEDKIENAYDLFQGTDGWQRDHIYYNLTSTQPNGPFSYEFKEALTSFRMTEADPMGAYNLISDATDDPHVQSSLNSNSQNAFWTSNSYSFRVHVVYNSKNGLGTEFTTVFPVAAYDLWDVQYNDIPMPGFWPWQTDHLYVPVGVTPKTVNMREEIFNWDIANYATTVLVKFEEVDTQTNIERTVTTADTYATNFGLDQGTIFAKIGLKFGASATSNQTVSTKITYQEGSDDLGQGSVNFADKILIDKYIVPLAGTMYDEREYTCGYCRFTMRPVKVQ